MHTGTAPPPQTYQVARYVHALPAFVARDLRRPHLLPPGVREVIKEADKPAKQGVVLACLSLSPRWWQLHACVCFCVRVLARW